MATTFEEVIRWYHQEGVVFQSCEKMGAAYYFISSIEEDHFVVSQLESSSSEQFSFKECLELLEEPKEHPAPLALVDWIDNPVLQSTLLQSPEVCIAPDRKHLISLNSTQDITDRFGRFLSDLNVDKKGGTPKLYKPILLACVLDGIRKHKLDAKRLDLDWLMNRFIKMVQKHGIQAGLSQAANGIIHLTGDLFWMLAYDSPNEFLKYNTSPKKVLGAVKFATIKEPFTTILEDGEKVAEFQNTLEEHWLNHANLQQEIIDENAFNFDVLDKAVNETIKPFLIEQDQLNDPDGEGYHHSKILPEVQPHLDMEALEENAKDHLESAIKAHVNLLSQFDMMPVIKFLREADEEELSERIIDLLYGERNLQERIDEFWEWSKIQTTDAGEKVGINALVIGYLLAVHSPTEFAFCKPTVYKAAANALLENGASKLSKNLNRVDRLIHATQFYQAALEIFQNRYGLPFEDLFHVHAAFYVMNNTYHGFPGWDEILMGASSAPIEEEVMHELNVILYGPPGTGKTYHTITRAVEICDGDIPESRSSLVERYRKLVAENRVGFVTFHQSYGYEDFVEGIRPVLVDVEANELSKGTSDVRYECRPGVFKRICSLAKSQYARKNTAGSLDLTGKTIWKMSLGDTQIPEEASVYDECIENGYLLMGYGWGVNFEDCGDKQAIYEKLEAVEPELENLDYQVQLVDTLKHRMSIGDLVVISDGNYKFRGIAQVSGEYSFLERETYQQMRPVEWLLVLDESLPHDVIYQKIFSQRTLYQLSQSSVKSDALQELVGGTAEDSNNYVLIIDEINRGNIAKILGELITLLEPDKRLGATNELQVTLPYSGDTFGVPQNVYLIGTMNTADRSIALLDIALRRRFQFVEMMPDRQIIQEFVGEDGDVGGIDIPQLLETINARIELLYDRDHQIGHSFFLKVNSLVDLKDVFCQKVIPLLQEYFYGDWEKVCLILGCPFSGNSKQNSSPIIKSISLSPSKLLNGGDELVDDKVRCEVNPDFVKETSDSALRPFFQGVTTQAGVA